MKGGDGTSLAGELSGALRTLRYGTCCVLEIVGIAMVGMGFIDATAKEHESGPRCGVGYADDNEAMSGKMIS